MAWCRVFLEKLCIHECSWNSVQLNFDTMPPHYYATLATIPLLIVTTKFNRKYIYYATTYPRYYATWGTVLQCINETINATNETIKRLWNGKSIQYVHVYVLLMLSTVVSPKLWGIVSWRMFFLRISCTSLSIRSHACITLAFTLDIRNYCTVLYIILKYM